MSVQRTPPRDSLMSGGGSGSGSVPNLTTCSDESFVKYSNTRKRKERSEEEEYNKNLVSFRTEIMTFLNDFAKTQNENLSIIKDEIITIKDEIKTIKSATENFTLQVNQINNDIENIKIDYSITQEKIKNIEKEISMLKSTDFPSHSASNIKSPFLSYENLILELNERSEREKNVVIVGVPERNDKSLNARLTHDSEQYMQLISTLIENCPKPNKLMRLGKYVPGKDRPLKICYTNRETPKILLQNRSKLPEKIKMYSDQTPAQKRYLQHIKDELKRRLEDGEKDLVIKYNKGTPCITKIKNDKKN